MSPPSNFSHGPLIFLSSWPLLFEYIYMYKTCCICLVLFVTDQLILDRKICNKEIPPGGRLSLPLSAVFSCQKSFIQRWRPKRFPPSTLSCLLLLPLFRCYLGHHIFWDQRGSSLIISRRHSLMQTSWCSGSYKLPASVSSMSLTLRCRDAIDITSGAGHPWSLLCI